VRPLQLLLLATMRFNSTHSAKGSQKRAYLECYTPVATSSSPRTPSCFCGATSLPLPLLCLHCGFSGWGSSPGALNTIITILLTQLVNLFASHLPRRIARIPPRIKAELLRQLETGTPTSLQLPLGDKVLNKHWLPHLRVE